jgi:hypothetical protein
LLLCHVRQSSLVPSPACRTMPMAAAGAAAMMDAAPAFAGNIDDAAMSPSEASYSFLKEIDWTSDGYAILPTLGPLVMVMAIDMMMVWGAAMDPAAFKAGGLAHSMAVPNIDAKGVASLAGFTATKMLVVAAAALAVCHLRQSSFVPPPAGHTMPLAAAVAAAMMGAALAFADKIDDAAKTLSEASYPFMMKTGWASVVFATLPTLGPLEVVMAIDKMLIMGAATDLVAHKAGVLALSKAILDIDAMGVTTLADFTATNAAFGHLVASAGQQKTMDVCYAVAKCNLGVDVGPFIEPMVKHADAGAAFSAVLEFKDVVKASLR